MNRIARISLITVATLAMVLSPVIPNARAQTGTSGSPIFAPTTMSTNPPTTGNTFLDQVGLFWTQPDRGLGTWTTTNGQPKTVDVYVGACFENNINADGIIGVDYALHHNAAGNGALVVDGFARIFNSDKTLKSVGAGPGFELATGDLKVGGYLDAVYRLDDHCAAIEPKLALKNGVGKNAFLMTALATDFEIKSRNAGQHPFLSTCFGFNY